MEFIAFTNRNTEKKKPTVVKWLFIGKERE